VTFETRVDAVDKSQASEIQTEADNSNVSERPHSDKQKLHVCTVCDKRFVWRGSLNEHRKRHSGEHVYLCSECEKRFSSRTRYDTRCYFNVRSKADISQLNLPHGTDN